MSEEHKKPKRPGPEPERLKIEVDWEEAVRRALKKERPEGGWPDKPQSDSESNDDKGTPE